MRAVTLTAIVAQLLASAGGPSSVAAQTRGVPPPPPIARPAPSAGVSKPSPSPAAETPLVPVAPSHASLPDGYVIGPDDVLIVVFWREKDLSGEVTVRPDGRISIPLLQDLVAAGLTPEQLRDKLNVEALRFVEDPNATVVVKEINSRRVFITGQVTKPGPYRLTSPTTVVQLISMAGGLLEYADKENIAVMRTENGVPVSYRFNYKDITQRKNLKQNIALMPGDTVLVP